VRDEGTRDSRDAIISIISWTDRRTDKAEASSIVLSIRGKFACLCTARAARAKFKDPQTSLERTKSVPIRNFSTGSNYVYRINSALERFASARRATARPLEWINSVRRVDFNDATRFHASSVMDISGEFIRSQVRGRIITQPVKDQRRARDRRESKGRRLSEATSSDCCCLIMDPKVSAKRAVAFDLAEILPMSSINAFEWRFLSSIAESRFSSAVIQRKPLRRIKSRPAFALLLPLPSETSLHIVQSLARRDERSTHVTRFPSIDR